jgi:putative flippase GtrA
MLKQFIVFCGVGGINTIAGLAVILLLSEIAELQYMLANALGYAAGLCLSFVLHKKITFQDQGKSWPQFGSFILIFGIAYAIQFVALVLLVDFLNMYQALAQIFAVGLYTVISYAGNSLLTFKNTGKGKS